MEIKELKEQISIEQIISIMRDFGVEGIPTLDGKALIYRSICHNSDSLKLYLYLETKAFYCYSHCHSMDIVNLVEKVMNYTTEQSVYFLMNKIGIRNNHHFKEGFDDEEPVTNEDWQMISGYYNNTYQNRKEELVVRDTTLLDRFYNLYHINFVNDGISTNTMKSYNIKFDIEHNRIIIPHYDSEGNLVAIRSRNLEQSELDKGRKYIPITMNGKLLSAPTSLYLYGLNKNKENIKKAKRIIIFESEKSVMQLETMYPGANISVALNGSSLSKYHIEILRELVEEVVLALDKEYKVIGSLEERKYLDKLRKKIIDKLSPFFNISLMWDVNGLLQYKDSPSDKGREVFMNLFENRWLL
ncbi:MAG: hypothetical protein RSH78_01260 [Bacilli bacterium]